MTIHKCMYNVYANLLHTNTKSITNDNLLFEFRVQCREVAGRTLGPVVLQHMPALGGGGGEWSERHVPHIHTSGERGGVSWSTYSDYAVGDVVLALGAVQLALLHGMGAVGTRLLRLLHLTLVRFPENTNQVNRAIWSCDLNSTRACYQYFKSQVTVCSTMYMKPQQCTLFVVCSYCTNDMKASYNLIMHLLG